MRLGRQLEPLGDERVIFAALVIVKARGWMCPVVGRVDDDSATCQAASTAGAAEMDLRADTQRFTP